MSARAAADLGGDEFVNTLGVMRALADPKRMALFRILREKERCVSDMVATSGLPQPLVSHHLRVLADAGLVKARRNDGFTLYAVDPRGLGAAYVEVAALLDTRGLADAAQVGGNPGCCRDADATPVPGPPDHRNV